jgi:CRP-like cAMP-binding protein
MLRDVYLFDGTPSTFVGVLSTMMAVDLFVPGTLLVTQGLPVFDLYVITSGTCRCTVPHDVTIADPFSPGLEEQPEWDEETSADCGEAFDELGVGDAFGEPAFCFRIIQPWSVCALSLVRTLSLNRDGWKAVLASRPDYARSVMDSVAERVCARAAEDAEADYSPYPALAKAVRKAQLEMDGPLCRHGASAPEQSVPQADATEVSSAIAAAPAG